jgi:hypothetical protein
LGLIVQHHQASLAYLRSLGRHASTWMLVASVLTLALWLRPWSGGHKDIVVSKGHLSPQWLRVAPGGCVSIRNDDATAYVVAKASPPAALEPGRTSTLCFAGNGVKRVKLGTGPWSGGFVFVDPEAAR